MAGGASAGSGQFRVFLLDLVRTDDRTVTNAYLLRRQQRRAPTFNFGASWLRSCREPITLYEEQILDGRHRARACEELGVGAHYVLYNGDAPAAYVLSLNVKRRQLSQSQKAMLATDFLPHLTEEAKRRQGAHAKTAPRDGQGRVLPKSESSDSDLADGRSAAHRRRAGRRRPRPGDEEQILDGHRLLRGPHGRGWTPWWPLKGGIKDSTLEPGPGHSCERPNAPWTSSR